jgi:ferredoxin-like protein FixX
VSYEINKCKPNNKPCIIIHDNEKRTCMLIYVAIPRDIYVINKEAEMILEYKACVENKNKCGISNNRGDWNRFKITQTVPQQHKGKARN